MSIKMKILDISGWNNNIKWSELKKDGYNGVIIRAGYSTELDSNVHHINEALKNGFHVGAYWFIYSLNVNEAREEAKTFADFMEKYKGKITLPLFADFEYDTERWANENAVSFSKEDRTDIITAFLEVLEKRGWYAGYYANYDYLENKLNVEKLKKYDLWYAQYTDNPSEKYMKIANIWQFTSEGKAYSDNNYSDLNYSYLDYPKIIKENGLNGFTFVKKKEKIMQGIKVLAYKNDGDLANAIALLNSKNNVLVTKTDDATIFKNKGAEVIQIGNFEIKGATRKIAGSNRKETLKKVLEFINSK